MKYIHPLIVFLLVVVAQSSFAQTISPFDYHSNTVSVPSPNAATLQKYGDMPVDLFTGTPSIEIPLSTLSTGPITVPLKLSYNANGIMVNEMPGVAGLGWDLICGGAITRKVNGIPDEFNNPNPNATSAQEPFVDKGYFFTGDYWNNAQWNTTAYMKMRLNQYMGYYYGKWKGMIMDGEPDEFHFSFGGYSGSFYRSEQGEWKIKSKQNLGLEISHELVSNNTFKLYERFNELSDEQTNIYASDNYSYVASLFTKFTITAPDGLRYEFGGDTSAIEFSRGPLNLTTPPVSNVPGVFNADMESKANYVTANAWRLTRITAPDGSFVVFNYKRGKVVIKKSKIYTPGFADASVTDPNNAIFGDQQQTMTANAVNPSYLSSVETPLQRIDFVTSTAIELGPSASTDINPPSDAHNFRNRITTNYGGLGYAALALPGNNIPNFNRQLDSIKIFDKINNNYVSGFKLYQRADPSRRRTLDSLKQFGFSGSATVGTYQFSYRNVELLPGYETLVRDHYGYYNGGPEPAIGQAQFPGRAPHTSCLNGLITKIVYPTGGETDFDFGTAAYDKAVLFDPSDINNPVQLYNESGIAGIRIEKITHKANYASPEVVSNYFYVNNYPGGGTTSSGILGMKIPYAGNAGYVDQIKYTINGVGPICEGEFLTTNVSDDGSEWVSMVKGGIVTYSEVTEQKADGSFTVYKFSNNDQQQYRDVIHDNFATADGVWINAAATSLNLTGNTNFRISSNDLERGNILSETAYKNNGIKVSEKLYTYRDDPDRKMQFIKAFSHKELYTTKRCGSTSLGSIPRGWTYKIYCYNNPLKNIVENLYDDNGIVTSNSKAFTYDLFGNVTETKTLTSDNREITERVRYNSDPAYLSNTALSSDALALSRLFQNYKIKAYPVEKISYLGPPNAIFSSLQVIDASLFKYRPDYPVLSEMLKMELSAPFNAATASYTSSKINATGDFEYDNRYRTQKSYTYASWLNGTALRPVSISAKTTGNESYTWDYNSALPSSVTRNAKAEQDVYAYTGFEGRYLDYYNPSDNKGNWYFDPINILKDGGGVTGKAYYYMYSGAPGINMIASRAPLPPGKNYILSFWATGTTPSIARGTTAIPLGQPLRTFNNNWKYYECAITGDGNTVSITGPNSGPYNIFLDDVKLYPAEATMLSYTYDPVTGNATSVSDMGGRVIFYTYDIFGRLLLEKDQDGHIVKQHNYQIQGPQ